jgi:hypothetical protein
MTHHFSWTDIENFHTVRKAIKQYPQLLNGLTMIRYKAKVKLHGTNAAIQITSEGKVAAQSRTSIITSQSDNAGFAKWVEEREKYVKGLAPGNGSVIIYGEWCGPGVMKGVAVNQIPERILAIFALREIHDDVDVVYYEPDIIRKRLPELPGSYIIDWYNNGEKFEVDWTLSADNLESVLNIINARVESVEACDPWIEKLFGVKGVGEGLVFYPVTSTQECAYKFFSDMCFKAKGEKHKTVAKTKPAQADPTVAANVKAFAEMVVTPARLEQGARLVAGGELTFDTKNIGAFLKWLVNDVHKETSAELAASGLDEKYVNKTCSELARNWYLEQFKKT